MREPVVASDGMSYEKTAIEKWLAQSVDLKSPMTGECMDTDKVMPNNVLRCMIADFYDLQKAD